MRISDWSSDVCSSDLPILGQIPPALPRKQVTHLRHPHRIVGVGKLQRPNRRPLADEYRDMDEDPDDQRDPNRRQPGLETRIGTARRARPGPEVRPAHAPGGWKTNWPRSRTVGGQLTTHAASFAHTGTARERDGRG